MSIQIDEAEADFVRRMTLAVTCFCGAADREGGPMRCLAHGYCQAHLTPVKDQITTSDRQRLAKRIGIHPDLAAQLWGGV